MQGKGQIWGGSWAGFPFAFHSQARGVWLMSAADKGDEDHQKTSEPFYLSSVFPSNFICRYCVVCLLVSPLRRGREHQGPG